MNVQPHHRSAPASLRQAELRMSGMSVVRRSYAGRDLQLEPAVQRRDVFQVTTQLLALSDYKLWRAKELIFDGHCADGALTISDMREEWRSHHLSPFDHVSFQIPLSYMRDFLADSGHPAASDLYCEPLIADAVVRGLAHALLPALEKPETASKLFLDQMGMALMVHLTHTYAGLHFPIRRKGTLAPWQEKRASEYLVAHLNADFSIADLAEECDLSRSHFIKAFKETFGKTPYRWLTEYRISKSKELLATGAPIAEIALICGFSDQSHLTRVFAQMSGETPGSWRRRHKD